MKTSQKSAYLFALAAVLAWSTVSTAFKLSLEHLSPLGLLFFASLTATLFLCLIIIFWHGKKGFFIDPRGFKKSLLAGILNPFVYYLMLFVAYDRLLAQEAQVLNYTWAIVLSALSIIILKERFRIKDIIALFLSFFGVFVIFSRGKLNLMGSADPLGAILAVSTSIVWATYWIINMKDKRPAELKLFFSFLIGSLAISLYAVIRGQLNQSGLFTDNGNPLLGVLGAVYVGIFEMGFTFILWQKALEKSSNTATISNLIFLTPFISLVFISLILHESIHPATLIGLAIIVGSNLWQKFRG